MIRYELMGAETLAKALQQKSETDFRKVVGKNLLEMRNRAVSSDDPSKGGTPRDSGELRLSTGTDTNRELMGYTKDYAPHVNYGHRIVVNGRTVGFVKGQYFLQTNVNIQRPIFREDLIRKMRE